MYAFDIVHHVLVLQAWCESVCWVRVGFVYTLYCICMLNASTCACTV